MAPIWDFYNYYYRFGCCCIVLYDCYYIHLNNLIV